MIADRKLEGAPYLGHRKFDVSRQVAFWLERSLVYDAIEMIGAKMAGMHKGDAISIVGGSDVAERAIIAFAGIQAILGGIELWEFSKALSPHGPAASDHQRPVAFVRERPALWYNSIDPDWLKPFVTGQSGRKVVTLGNSMGGFAAILFSLLLPGIARSIAFCPQYSVNPRHCPWEIRWQEQVAAINTWRFETCLSGGQDVGSAQLDHIIFCGQDVPNDVRHAELIIGKASQPVSAFLIQGCGHDVARVLKQKGVLVPLLDMMIDNLAKPGALAAYLRAHGVAFDLVGNRET